MSPSSAHYWQSPWQPAGNGEMGLEEPHPLRSTELRLQLKNWHKSCSWAFWWPGLEILTRSKTSFIIFISIANEEQWLPSTVVGCLGLGTYMFIISNVKQPWEKSIPEFSSLQRRNINRKVQLFAQVGKLTGGREGPQKDTYVSYFRHLSIR